MVMKRKKKTFQCLVREKKRKISRYVFYAVEQQRENLLCILCNV